MHGRRCAEIEHGATVADVFPGVPHQCCQYHALREAAEVLWKADRHLLVEAKMELRGLRDVEERTRRPTIRSRRTRLYWGSWSTAPPPPEIAALIEYVAHSRPLDVPT